MQMFHSVEQQWGSSFHSSQLSSQRFASEVEELRQIPRAAELQLLVAVPLTPATIQQGILCQVLTADRKALVQRCVDLADLPFCHGNTWQGGSGCKARVL